MPVRNLQILLILILVCGACYIQAERLKYAGKIGTAIQLIEQNYVESKDPEDLYLAAMEGIVSELDQFSEFIPPKRYQEFQSVIEQKFGGLGVLIEGPPAAPRLTVVAPIPGTPAFNAGLQAGDMILEINGVSTEGLSATDATQIMRGPVGEDVELLVQGMNTANQQRLTIRRDDIQVDSVYGDRIQADSSWNYFIEEDPRIAYIRITLFGERTVGEFEKALAAIRSDAQALVLDLRYNPGGILPTAVEMCDMLIDSGVIVSTRGRRAIFGAEFDATSRLELDLSIPIVLLVNDQSASASEIMAGCLQDLGRAEIAGQRSYGKGTVQQVFELENDQTALKFTTARFYRPSGKNIHRTEGATDADVWGVIPNEGFMVRLSDAEMSELVDTRRQRDIVRSQHDARELPTFNDRQLNRGVAYLLAELGDAPDPRRAEARPPVPPAE
ncbi:MAG: S41 family peptidase [Planctomycetales bacterium]|nr:S41 family peptidase [Planctomycetales bacterium]